MAKANEQLEDILDDLSVIKNNNVAIECIFRRIPVQHFR